jgi:hypothetical protein
VEPIVDGRSRLEHLAELSDEPSPSRWLASRGRSVREL